MRHGDIIMAAARGNGADSAGEDQASANLMLEWCPLHLDARSRATWFQQLVRAITQRMHIFDAVGLGVRTDGDHDTIMSFAVLERFPLLLATIDYSSHTLTVLRSSHRDTPRRHIRQPASDELSLPTPEFRPPSAPREGRGRPLTAISSDKIKGGKRLRPERREGHGRPASAFPSDKCVRAAFRKAVVGVGGGGGVVGGVDFASCLCLLLLQLPSLSFYAVYKSELHLSCWCKDTTACVACGRR